MPEPNWEKLSDSAQDAVSDLVALLAQRFTGEITLKCIEGGIREFRESRSRRSGDLGNLSQKRE